MLSLIEKILILNKVIVSFVIALKEVCFISIELLHFIFSLSFDKEHL